MYWLSYNFIIFIIYSFIGYISEIIFVSLENKKITNRGFLCGPICPIYGVGGLLMWFFLKDYNNDIVAIFCLGALLATIIEYITGWALEKIFHNKWWDYSNNKFNVDGRVCLLNTILFGIAAVIVVKLGGPLMNCLLGGLSKNVIIIIAILLMALFILDMIYSWIIAFNLRNNIIVVEDLKNNKLNYLPELLEEYLAKQVNKVKRIPKRVSVNFPKFILKYKIEFDIINNLIQKIKEENKKRKKAKK